MTYFLIATVHNAGRPLQAPLQAVIIVLLAPIHCQLLVQRENIYELAAMPHKVAIRHQIAING